MKTAKILSVTSRTVDIIETVSYPRPSTWQKEFYLFYMCQLWALHTAIKRKFFTFSTKIDQNTNVHPFHKIHHNFTSE